MWKIGRRLFYAARREGSVDMEEDGELLLQRRFAERSAKLGKPLRIVDVGGNLGQWSLSMLRELDMAGAPPAELIVFEPMPSIHDRLRETLATQTRHRIELRREAAADAAGEGRFVLHGDSDGTHHLDTRCAARPGTVVDVRLVRLDEVLTDDEVDILKIDAEGFDPVVIRGASGLLARQRIGVLQFEYSHLYIRSRSYLFDVFEMAAEAGYKVALLTRAGLEVFDAWHPDLEKFIDSNLVVCRADVLHWLPAVAAAYLPDNTRALSPLGAA